MYCALTGSTTGRILGLRVEGDRVGGLRSADVSVRALPGVLEEMDARATALRAALARGSAEALPRCRWFGRGCEFQTGGRCDCSGSEPEAAPRILEAIAEVRARPDLDLEYLERVQRLPPTKEGTVLERFRDLLYPRRAYFERVTPAIERAIPVPSPSEAPDLYARIAESLETGPIGEVARLSPRAEEPTEDVTGFRGAPYLLRTTRTWDPIAPEDLVRRAPQYALELGYRCAVAGTDVARVFLGYERAEEDRDRVDVLEVRFGSLTPFARRIRQTRRALEGALAAHRPADLPACPDWMYADCPYAAECACGDPAARSQR